MKLKVGTSLQLEELMAGEPTFYKSRVVGFENDYVIHIDYPIHLETNRTGFLLNGTELAVIFVDEYKTTYRFLTKVVGRSIENVPVLKIIYDGDEQLEKIQRREYVRVDVSLDVSLETKNGERYNLLTTDLSAGGVAINVKEIDAFEEGDFVHLFIVIPQDDGAPFYLSVDATVVRIWEADYRRLASFQFVALDDEVRQRVVRYCFDRQLKERQERRGILK